ncbi:MAG TPA: response regulator [Chloroflexota bacterium]
MPQERLSGAAAGAARWPVATGLRVDGGARPRRAPQSELARAFGGTPRTGGRLGPPDVPLPVRTVLIADDDAVTRLLVEEVLRSEAGVRVRAACGGRAAIQALAETPPDLVLLDLMMPDMDGFAVLRWMRAHPRTAGVPVIVLTAVDAAVDHALACGCAGFVRKPLQLDQLVEVVRTQLAAAAA